MTAEKMFCGGQGEGDSVGWLIGDCAAGVQASGSDGLGERGNGGGGQKLMDSKIIWETK